MPEVLASFNGSVHPYSEAIIAMNAQDNNTLNHRNLDSESKTIIQSTGFTQIHNNIINNIKNGDAFLVWAYLYSKTNDWKTIKQNIKNVYGFGNDKIEKIFSYLARAKLIEYVRIKCANGKYSGVQIHILNGSEFDAKQAFKGDAPLPPKTRGMENKGRGNGKLLNKDITKDLNKLNKKNYSANEFAQEKKESQFEVFWKVYPVKKNKLRTRKIWDKNNYDKMVDIIFADICLRLREEAQWQNKQFIPHPATYLHNKLWTDEITQVTENTKISKSDSFSRYLQQNNGGTYDQHGNTYDPFR